MYSPSAGFRTFFTNGVAMSSNPPEYRLRRPEGAAWPRSAKRSGWTLRRTRANCCVSAHPIGGEQEAVRRASSDRAGEGDGEDCLATRLATSREQPFVRLGNGHGDREAEAGAWNGGVGRIMRICAAIEAIKDMLQIIRGYAWTIIDHLEAGVLVLLIQQEQDLLLLTGAAILNRIIQQHQQHLLDLFTVG